MIEFAFLSMDSEYSIQIVDIESVLDILICNTINSVLGILNLNLRQPLPFLSKYETFVRY